MVDLETACLFAVFVLPEFEGKGIGKRLIQVREAALFERHPAAWLETAKAAVLLASIGILVGDKSKRWAMETFD